MTPVPGIYWWMWVGRRWWQWEFYLSSLCRTTHNVSQLKENYLTHSFDKQRNQGPGRGSNLSEVTQQWEEWGQELRSSASLAPPSNGFLKRVGFSWHLPGTRRQMGKWVGRMHEERFRAHEWEILDNPSFLSEVIEMVKRGRIKCNIFGKCSPDTHKRYHFLWDFILSNCFSCTGLEPVKTRKAPLQFSEQNSIHQGRAPP